MSEADIIEIAVRVGLPAFLVFVYLLHDYIQTRYIEPRKRRRMLEQERKREEAYRAAIVATWPSEEEASRIKGEWK